MIQGKFSAIGLTHRLPRVREDGFCRFSFIFHNFLLNTFKTSCIKSNLLFAVSISFLLITQTAHADFRKALEAYQNRDGTTMLAEVKDAVGKKSDDGLMLFLMAINLDAATSDYDETTKQSKSTLRAILPQPKWDEMRELLTQATNNSTVESQYFLNVENRQFSRELMAQRLRTERAKHGEKPKTEYTNQELNQAYSDARKAYIDKGVVAFADHSTASMVTKQAELGDPYAQSLLGFFSLGFSDFTVPPCEEIKTFAPLCKTKDETRGYAWLKKAVKTYEQDGLLSEGYGQFANGMCGFLLSKTNPSAQNLHQAYLWCFMAVNLGNPFAEDLLGKMHNSGSLKKVSPQLDAAWDTLKRDEVLHAQDIKEWPELVLQVRKELTSENTPMFSYLIFGRPSAYALEVYSDGRVFIKDMQVTGYKTLLTKVSSQTLKLFLEELHKVGIDNWPLFTGRIVCGSCTTSPPAYLRLSLRENGSIRHLKLGNATNENEYRIARMKVLVDKYFPTRQLRIELGNNGKEQQRKLDEEKKWVELSKKGELK